MKKILVMAIGLVGVGAGVKLATFRLPPQPELLTQGGPTQPALVPGDIREAKRRLVESSERMEKQLLPLLKQMPEEMKRMKKLMADNERLIQQADELARTGQIPPR